MRIPLLVAVLATLILSTPALAATEAEIATTRTTVNVILPVLAIAITVVILLILKAVKLESKAGETPWSIVVVLLLVFFLGTLSTSLLNTGKWVSDAIVKSYHPDAPTSDGKATTTTTTSGDPVGSPADYVELKGATLYRNSKTLPSGWEIGMTQVDGQAGVPVTSATARPIDLTLPVIIFFDPDAGQQAKGKKALGTMKLR